MTPARDAGGPVESSGERAGASTLVVHCSTYRFRRAFDEFIEKTLAIEDYDRIAVPGGPQFLAALEYLPKFAWVGNRWMKFLVQTHELRRVVLITHLDCNWYLRLLGTGAEMEARQREDLRQARDKLLELLPGLTVEAYFAIRRNGRVEFLPVAS